MSTSVFFKFDHGDVVQIQPCLSFGIVRGLAEYAAGDKRYLVRRVDGGKSVEDWEREIDLKEAELSVGFNAKQ